MTLADFMEAPQGREWCVGFDHHYQSDWECRGFTNINIKACNDPSYNIYYTKACSEAGAHGKVGAKGDGNAATAATTKNDVVDAEFNDATESVDEADTTRQR